MIFLKKKWTPILQEKDFHGIEPFSPPAKTYLDDGTPKKIILSYCRIQQNRGCAYLNPTLITHVFRITFSFWLVHDNDQSRCVDGAKLPNLLHHSCSSPTIKHGDVSWGFHLSYLSQGCTQALRQGEFLAARRQTALLQQTRWGSLGLDDFDDFFHRFFNILNVFWYLYLDIFSKWKATIIQQFFWSFIPTYHLVFCIHQVLRCIR